MAEPPVRLYLTVPPGLAVERLDAALRAGDVACVLLPAGSDAGPRAHVGSVQARGAAALVPDDLDLANRCGADGVHVSRPAGLATAIRRGKPAAIVGAGGLGGRDDAMSAGEAGVDYVMIGEDPAEPFVDRLDRVAWWAEIFEVPCVAVAHAPDEVADLAEAGAEFVALGAWAWEGDVATAIRAAMAALAEGNARFVARMGERV